VSCAQARDSTSQAVNDTLTRIAPEQQRQRQQSGRREKESHAQVRDRDRDERDQEQLKSEAQARTVSGHYAETYTCPREKSRPMLMGFRTPTQPTNWAGFG
jgi:hypothetical protein